MDLFLEFGPPNCGKGRLQKILCATFGFIPLSVGDVCREQKRQNSDIWQAAREDMAATGSTLWSTEILMKAMNLPFERAVQQGTVAFDGWLRDKQQIRPLISWALGHNIDRIIIIDFLVTDDLCMKRAGERGREDDVDIHTRLRDFHRDSEPALSEFLGYEDVLNFDRITFETEKAEEDEVGYYRDFVTAIGLLRGFKMVCNSSDYNVLNSCLRQAFDSERKPPALVTA